jgi:acetylornithine deacetylase
VTLSGEERRVCEAIAAAEDELVELLSELIAFDTTAHVAGAPARDEARLQEHLARRLRRAGAAVEVGEPEAALVAGHRMIPAGFDFTGRPQLVARFPGRGGGRTLLLCGHVDVVAPGPDWAGDPFTPVVVDGVVRGRGACDMKGGVAAMTVAAETLARLGVPLTGDVVVNTVTDEESTGAGGLVSALTLVADGAIVPEPTGLDVWVACRGSVLPTVVVEGRAGHAGLPARPADEGGAVNAIEKAMLVLDGLLALRGRWATLPRHPHLSPPDIVPTMVQGGEWVVSYPARCRIDCHVEYLPGQADDDGWGSLVEQEIAEAVAAAAAADPWLAQHPPQVGWHVGGVPPAEVPDDDPLVVAALGGARAVGRPSALGGMDNWHDGATLTVEAGIPAVCLGPGDIRLAHTDHESVPVADLVACAQAIAVAAMRFCG